MAGTARQIFTNQTENGNSLTFTTNGKIYVKISGSFHGATIDFQSKTNNSNDDFTSTGDTLIAVPCQVAVSYSPGMIYRLSLIGVHAQTVINAFVTV
jgi:hypothetical protein